MKREDGIRILETAIKIQASMSIALYNERDIDAVIVDGVVELAREVCDGKINMISAKEIAQIAVEISHKASQIGFGLTEIRLRTASLLSSSETFRIAKEIWMKEKKEKT